MEKKITISVITEEGNYGWETTIFWLYISISTGSSPSRHIQDNYQFPQNILGTFPEAPQWTDSRESAFPVICLLWRHTNRSTALLTLYLVKLIIELTSLKQTNWHCTKPKQHQLSYVEFSWYIFSLFFSLFSVKHLEILSWVTVINIGCSWYLFCCGQLKTRRILHSSCQRKFKIGDDNAWKKEGECTVCVQNSQWVTGQIRKNTAKPPHKGKETIIYLWWGLIRFMIKIDESVITSLGSEISFSWSDS